MINVEKVGTTRIRSILSLLLIIIIFFGSGASADGESNEDENQSYTLKIIDMDSENYYMDFAEIIMKNKITGEVVFDGYIINSSLKYNREYGYSQDWSELPVNLSLPAGEYIIEGERPRTNVLVGHKWGDLICKMTVTIQSNASIILFFDFEPLDKSQSETTLIFVEALSVSIEVFLIIIGLCMFLCVLINYILRNKYNMDILALIILYIPLIILLAMTFYFGWLYESRDFKIENLGYSSVLLLFTSMLVLFIFGIISFKIRSEYKKEQTKEGMAKIYLTISIFLTCGIGILFIYFLSSSYMTTCYIPLPPGPSPKLTGEFALLLMSFRNKLQDKFYKNGSIGKDVYDKLKRNN